MKLFLILFLSFMTVANYSSASMDRLDKFNGNFRCAANNQNIPTCLDINIKRDCVDIVGCGFEQSKQFDIISKNSTSLIIGSQHANNVNIFSKSNKPMSTFIYVLTDIWGNEGEIGKKFKFEQIEINQENTSLDENTILMCDKF